MHLASSYHAGILGSLTSRWILLVSVGWDFHNTQSGSLLKIELTVNDPCDCLPILSTLTCLGYMLAFQVPRLTPRGFQLMFLSCTRVSEIG